MSSSERISPAPTPNPPRPPRLTVAAAICGLEALTLIAGGVYLLVMGVLGQPDSPEQAEMGGVTLIVLGVIPLLAARGLLLCRAWSRGPAVITQVMALPVAYTLLTSIGGMIPAGIALAVAAVTGLVLIVSASANEALGITDPARDSQS
ncbi:hypothetical protein [Streptomyces sp. NPDC088400]|uniref:hypothetical protein n=1 Tax=Streptomyces sp. NPDC088400 TaxID=3365861 RepID=UPI0038202484